MWLLGNFFPPFGLASFAGAMVFGVISYCIFKKLATDMNVPVRDSTKNHNWTPITASSKSWYCSICEAFLIHAIGVYCDCCGVCADHECIKKANRVLKCKSVTSTNEIQLHHWVKGNLPLGAVCFICNEECCLEPGLVDYQCCWCQRTVHTNCIKQSELECDFGPYRSMIVPPFCVQLVRRKGALHKQLLLKGVKHPGWENWVPLIVVANKKSGNNDGMVVLSEFRKYLNPAQVIDLSNKKPTCALQWCVLLAPKVVRLLVAGGDGTISWMLTSSYKLDLEPEPQLAIIPLGTGNDLSRVLGWGRQNSSELDINRLLTNIRDARPAELDRWQVEIMSTRHLGIRIPNKMHYMYNYMSFGVDAQVALSFHKTRESIFYIYGNRLLNKLLYLCFGTQQAVTADCKNIEKRLDLFLDGVQISLPELESIVILNISSWGAGVNLWGLTDAQGSSQSYHDGVLEVVGIYSSFHIAQLQMGLSSPLKIGQAKTIEIRLKEKAPVQIDGEPWEQGPVTFKISFVNRCPVLLNTKKTVSPISK